MNEDDENVENSMSLSFLDVISCGMVSSIFLAIIFSVIGYMPAITLKTDEFIAIILELEENDTQVWNINLTTPENQKNMCVPLDDFDLTTGRYTSGKNSQNFYNQVQLFGFPNQFFKKNSNASGNFRIFFISKPQHGNWKVEVFVKDQDSFCEGPEEPKNIRIVTSSKKEVSVKVDGLTRSWTF